MSSIVNQILSVRGFIIFVVSGILLGSCLTTFALFNSRNSSDWLPYNYDIEIIQFGTCTAQDMSSVQNSFMDGTASVYACGILVNSTTNKPISTTFYWFYEDDEGSFFSTEESYQLSEGAFFSELQEPNLASGIYRVEMRRAREVLATATFSVVSSEPLAR